MTLFFANDGKREKEREQEQEQASKQAREMSLTMQFKHIVDVVSCLFACSSLFLLSNVHKLSCIEVMTSSCNQRPFTVLRFCSSRHSR